MEWDAQGASAGLQDALDKLHRELPGWWWSAGRCHLTADATIGPDRTGIDCDLLKWKLFDEGFDAALAPPYTVADALLYVIEQAKTAKADYAQARKWAPTSLGLRDESAGK